MARLTRNLALLALPADAPLTPRTFDQVIALAQLHEFLSCLQVIVITQLRELRLYLSVLSPEPEMRFDPLVSLLQHIDIGSSFKVCARGQTRKKANPRHDRSAEAWLACVFKRKCVCTRSLRSRLRVPYTSAL